MRVFPLLAASFIMNIIAAIFLICAIALVLIILIQKGRGGGLGAAFGGMAGGILGSKTGDFLTWVTIGLVGLFLTLAVVMAKFYKPTISSDFGTEPAVQMPASEQQRPQNQEQSIPLDDFKTTAGGEGAEANSLNVIE